MLTHGNDVRHQRGEWYLPAHGDKSLNFAVFSIHDELIGPLGILENMAVCQRLGYTILVDDKGGHRLDKKSLKKIKDEIFETNLYVFKQ